MRNAKERKRERESGKEKERKRENEREREGGREGESERERERARERARERERERKREREQRERLTSTCSYWFRPLVFRQGASTINACAQSPFANVCPFESLPFAPPAHCLVCSQNTNLPNTAPTARGEEASRQAAAAHMPVTRVRSVARLPPCVPGPGAAIRDAHRGSTNSFAGVCAQPGVPSGGDSPRRGPPGQRGHAPRGEHAHRSKPCPRPGVRAPLASTRS